MNRDVAELINAILNETTTFCEECGSREICPEDECVLYRIEKIVEKELKYMKIGDGF